MGGGMSSLGVRYGSKAYKELKAQDGGERKKAERFQDFGAGHEAVNNSTRFYNEHSNVDEWLHGGLTSEEYDSIRGYTGNDYSAINKNLYTKDFDQMSPHMQQRIDDMVNGLSKFELDKGIQVTRQCDFKIFGAQSGEMMSVAQVKSFIKANADPKDGTLENKGFLSFGSNNHGASIDGWGLVIHAKVPPSIGAGAYVNPLSKHAGGAENEWLFNSHSRFKFDLSSIYKDSSGKIHVNAVWKGRGKHKK